VAMEALGGRLGRLYNLNNYILKIRYMQRLVKRKSNLIWNQTCPIMFSKKQKSRVLKGEQLEPNNMKCSIKL
jgi:hypothetical protein